VRRCGHSENDTYEFDLPLTKAQPMEAYEPGKCLECGTSVQMHPERTQLRHVVDEKHDQKSRFRFLRS
jgi:hypothetical protein